LPAAPLGIPVDVTAVALAPQPFQEAALPSPHRRLASLVAAAIFSLGGAAAAPAQTCSSTSALACGEVKTGTIGVVGETDCFTFTGEAGEVVELLAKTTAGGSKACAQLRDPSGDVVGGDACGQPATRTLPATGTYTIRLFEQSNDETGPYAVQMQVLSATASSCPAATLPCGANENGVLGSIVERDVYRFVAAAAGEVVSITVSDAASPFEACWQLYAADGSAVGTQQCAQDIRTLPAAGAYTIRVFDLANDETGAYRIDVNVVSATAGSCRDATLLCGAPHPGTIPSLGDDDVYWFTTTSPNEPVTITTANTSGSVNACWQLYDAAGVPNGGIKCGAAERILATPQTYVVRVFDLTYEGSGAYEITAAVSPACPATPTPTATATPTPTPTDGGEPTAGGGTPTPDASPSPGGDGTGTPGDGATPAPTDGNGATPTAASSGGGTPTPQGTPSVQSLEAVLDDFLCYATKATRGTPKFVPKLGVRLNDALESFAFAIRKPIALCAPADKDANGVADPAISLERYRIQRERRTPRFTRSTRHVVTALGALSLDTVRPDQLLVPTAQNASAPPALPDLTEHEVDRYKCYRVRVTRKTPKIPFDLQVTATDGLSSPARRFKVKSPTRLCVASDEDTSRLRNPAANLLCYPVKLIRGEPKHVRRQGLYLDNDLGPTRVDTLRETELCLPAVLLP
jgi:hypothetical protein